MKNDFSQLENRLDINFKNKDLLKQVFVHRSYLNENPKFELDHNERLEFLGDAVLELVTTEFLYNNYPNPEGELTNWRSALVRGQMISKIAADLGMNEYLLLSKGEQQSIGKARQLILANVFESLVGAIYIDQGYDVAKQFINKFLLLHLDEIIEKELYRDAKSKLQELSQEKQSVTPIYNVLSEAGPDHAKEFDMGVYIGDKLVGKGIGSSKQEAEQNAASDALSKFDK